MADWTRVWTKWRQSIARSREFLLSLQHEDGYWCGELEADSMLEADYIFGISCWAPVIRSG